jgi:dipeptidase D
MGVATAMALLDCDQTVKLPPLECLFTVDEETGLTGAFGLDGSLVTGKTLLNLDTEEWGALYIGCAGGGESELFLRDPKMEPVPEGHASLNVVLKGLRGGHSGCDIHNYRGNALVLLARAVAAVRARCPGGRLASLLGGDKHNAIPREAFATLTVPEGDLGAAREVLEGQLAAFKEEYGREEPGLELSAENATGPAGGVLPEAGAAGFLDLITLLPYGPMKMSHAVEGLVETSSNIASVKLLEDGRSLEIVCSTRSSLSGALEAVRAKIDTAGRLCGFDVKQDPAYPGWNPNPGSEVVALAKEVLGGMTGKEPEVLAIHAGLECGIIGEKCPGTDMVSYGPTICNPHTPQETVNIETVEPFFDLTLKLLQRLAERKA